MPARRAVPRVPARPLRELHAALALLTLLWWSSPRRAHALAKTPETFRTYALSALPRDTSVTAVAFDAASQTLFVAGTRRGDAARMFAARVSPTAGVVWLVQPFNGTSFATSLALLDGQVYVGGAAPLDAAASLLRERPGLVSRRPPVAVVVRLSADSGAAALLFGGAALPFGARGPGAVRALLSAGFGASARIYAAGRVTGHAFPSHPTRLPPDEDDPGDAFVAEIDPASAAVTAAVQLPLPHLNSADALALHAGLLYVAVNSHATPTATHAMLSADARAALFAVRVHNFSYERVRVKRFDVAGMRVSALLAARAEGNEDALYVAAWRHGVGGGGGSEGGGGAKLYAVLRRVDVATRTMKWEVQLGEHDAHFDEDARVALAAGRSHGGTSAAAAAAEIVYAAGWAQVMQSEQSGSERERDTRLLHHIVAIAHDGTQLAEWTRAARTPAALHALATDADGDVVFGGAWPADQRAHAERDVGLPYRNTGAIGAVGTLGTAAFAARAATVGARSMSAHGAHDEASTGHAATPATQPAASDARGFPAWAVFLAVGVAGIAFTLGIVMRHVIDDWRGMADDNDDAYAKADVEDPYAYEPFPVRELDDGDERPRHDDDSDEEVVLSRFEHEIDMRGRAVRRRDSVSEEDDESAGRETPDLQRVRSAPGSDAAPM